MLIGELKRRGVIRASIAYLTASWLLVQVAATVLPAYDIPPRALTILIAILGIGFIPTLVLSWKFELIAGRLARDKGRAGPPTQQPGATRRVDIAITALLVISVSYFAFDKFVLDPARDVRLIDEGRKEGRSSALLEAYGDKSIAVLPFVNMSPDPDQEYFSDGISEELLNLLAQIPELRVISRSTAFSFKGKEIDVTEIARKLNVAHILEGSVRKSGNRLRITAQLIDAQTDTHLWSDTYDRDFDDIFLIQDEISAKVVAELKLKLLGAMPKSDAVNPQAYELYLKARRMLHLTVDGSRSEEAILLLERALVLEPDWQPAIFALARAYWRLTLDEEEDSEYRVRILALVDRLEAIDRNGPAALGWRAWLSWQWGNDLNLAADYYGRAIEVDPYDLDLLRPMLTFLVAIRRLDLALPVSAYLLARDPACTQCVNRRAQALRYAGRHVEAAQVLESYLEWHPPTDSIYWQLGLAWLMAGDAERALGYFDKLGTPPGENLGRLLALHDLGREEEFKAEFETFRAISPPESIARVYAWTGDSDAAFLWLEEMVRQEGPTSAALARTDLYAKLQPDPRMQEFLERNGSTDEDLAKLPFNPKLPPDILSADTASGID